MGPYLGLTRGVAGSLAALVRAHSLRYVHTAFSNRPVNPAFAPFLLGGPSPCPSHYRPAFGCYAASALLPTGWHFRPPPSGGPSGVRVPQFRRSEPERPPSYHFG